MNSLFIETFYLFFEGVLLFQAAFFYTAYFILKRKDVIYYASMNFVAAIYFLFYESRIFFGIDPEIDPESSLYKNISFGLLLGLFTLYTLFLKEIFIETIEKHKYVKKIYKVTLVAFAVLYLLFVLFKGMGWSTNVIFYASHMANSPFCLAIVLLNYKVKSYKSLIIYSMFISFTCLVITLYFTIRYITGSDETILDKYPLALIKVSMLIDIILFQLAIMKSWNEREKHLATEKLLSQLAVEKLRNRISGELHDDIGSTLSGVSMYSYLTNKQIENGEIDNAKVSLQIIHESTNEIVDKLGDLVWSVNPKHETIDFLFERVEQFAIQLCAAKSIAFKSSISVNLEQGTISQENIHHLYLILKEVVNNSVKYSDASELSLHVKESDGILNISVADNGKGFETSSIQWGNGLKGIKKRAIEIGAILDLKTSLGSGCTVQLTLNKAKQVIQVL
jgi:signal transduction histidine kinase